MGCASSKILTRSGSIQDEVRRRLHSRWNDLQELKASKNDVDHQLLALLYSSSTATKTTKSVLLHEESDTKSTAETQRTDVKGVDANPSIELTTVETINAWELMDGLEEEREAAEEGSHANKSSASSGTVTSENFRSTLEKDEDLVVHTVDDYDAMVAGNKLKEEKKHVAETSKGHEVEVSEESDCSTMECSLNTPISEIHKEDNKSATAKASRRKAMAKGLSAIKIPSVEFSRSGSLRDWLLGGGQVMSSPGSYVTPKFGNFAINEPIGDYHAVFDPEMVAQFDRAMAELTMDEETFLEQILENSKEGHEEEDATRMEMSPSSDASTM